MQDLSPNRGFFPTPQLQLALDTLALDEAVDLARTLTQDLHGTEARLGFVEAGTPLIKMYGMAAIRRLRAVIGPTPLVADLKTADAGAYEANLALDAGADTVTVLAAADDATIRNMADAVHQRKGRIVADLIGIRAKVDRAVDVAALGVDMLCVHTGIDAQANEASPLADLANVVGATSLPVAVAGGITPATAAALLSYRPAVLIVGGAITGAADPRAALRAFEDILHRPQTDHSELPTPAVEQDWFAAAMDLILAENRVTLANLDAGALTDLAAAVCAAPRIFVTGQGRSGLVMRMMAVRLAHLGLAVTVVGETIMPPVQPGDLLIACSGSGATTITCAVAEQARQAGATVAVMTAVATSSLAQSADLVVYVDAPPKPGHQARRPSAQYEGSLFEQVTMLLGEALFLHLRADRDTQQLWSHHSNLE